MNHPTAKAIATVALAAASVGFTHYGHPGTGGWTLIIGLYFIWRNS